jgi:hypothetical protein
MKKTYSILQVAVFLISVFLSISWNTSAKKEREYYRLTVYHFNTAAQEKVLDNYLQNALVPVLHRMNIKNVGVFKSHTNDTVTDKTLYVLVPVQSLDAVMKIPAKLGSDQDYLSAGAEYNNAVYSSPSYTRMETILLQAFPLAPQLQQPVLNGPRKERVYELRSYESATENIFKNKVQMFNEGGEIDLFKRLNFNATFYGEVIAGGKMPNLMYMTCHENKTVRDANWKTFVDDPFWKKLSSQPEYQHNVSHIDIMFLYPTDYSDF